MKPIATDWKKPASGNVKAALFTEIASHLSGKQSTPYTPISKHDFMHNKVLVADGAAAATGSHNFSANATGNAESSITIRDEDLAAHYSADINDLQTAFA